MNGLTIRLSEELLQKLRDLAVENHRSLNSEVLVALERYVKQEAEKKEICKVEKENRQ